MNILMVLTSEFPPDIRVENEIKSLLKAGFGVHIACQTMKNLPLKDTYLNCTIHRRKIPRLIYKSSVACLDFPIYFRFWRKFILSLLKEYNFDALHIHDLPLAKVGLDIKKLFNIKVVLDLHENFPVLLKISRYIQTFPGKLFYSEKQWREYEYNMCSKVDKIIVVIDEAKERLKELGISPEKVFIVSNTHIISPEENATEILIKKSPSPVLIYGGGINEHRGLQYVINSIPLLIQDFSNIKLKIAGNGSYVENLKELAKKHHVEKNVDFIEYKPYREFLELIARSDIAIIPHVKSEHTDSTIPHKIFHYLYLGIPMLVSNCDPLERIVNEAKAGLVYSYDSPTHFAEQLKNLMKDYEFWKRNSINARQLVTTKYNWSIDSGRLLALYNELLLK